MTRLPPRWTEVSVRWSQATISDAHDPVGARASSDLRRPSRLSLQTRWPWVAQGARARRHLTEVLRCERLREQQCRECRSQCIRVARHEHDRKSSMVDACFPAELDAIHLRHLDIPLHPWSRPRRLTAWACAASIARCPGASHSCERARQGSRERHAARRGTCPGSACLDGPSMCSARPVPDAAR